MKVLILSGDDVRDLLPMADCIDAVADALTTLARGDAVQPLRSILRYPPGPGLLGVMPAQLGTPAVAGVKTISITPGGHGEDSHPGTVQLFDVETGRLLAILDASSITAIRTAAASALATRVLARRDASDLAILGTGTQAHSHLDAMATVRTLKRVRVWGRTPGNVARFVAQASAETNLPIEASASVREALDGADLVCTVTAAREPIVRGDWLADGCHVNAVGACTADTRELDGTAMARARVFTDRRESAEHEAGNLILAARDGAIAADHLTGELGDVLSGTVAGRTEKDQITLYQSLGIGVEDLAAGHLVYTRALAAGRGVEVTL